MKLNGHTILITGAGSGIGRAFAEAFHRLGNKVIICGRREDRLKELQRKCPGMVIRVCDVSSPGQRMELALWATHNFPALNVLMNNAGVQYAFNLKEKTDIKKVHDEIETNLVAPIHLSSLFAQHLTTKAEAAIINISSGLAFVPLAFMPVYCASKAGLHSFTLSLRHQLKETSVKVFEIAPPAVDTELGHDRRANKSESHGGIPVDDFLAQAMMAIENDEYEAAIAGAKMLKEKGQSAFEFMNGRVVEH